MSNYIASFHRQINDYKRRYGERYGVVSWHLLWFLLRNWFGGRRRFKRSGDTVNIGFFLPGGIGDIVIDGAYIDKFIKNLDCKYKIHLFVQQNLSDVQDLFADYETDVFIRSEKDMKTVPLDLLIEFRPYVPEIVFKRELFIANKSNFLTKYIAKISEFNARYTNLIDARNVFAQQTLFNIFGLNRVSGMDIAEILGVADTDVMTIKLANEEAILKSYGLKRDGFITIHRGVDIHTDAVSVKQWPIQNYNELIKLIRKKYPNIRIVQLGDSKERCPVFDDVDIDLSGKTSLKELMVFLKNSHLHIDNEGGMVHLRHALNGGQSVVLFGPTSLDLYKYPENINIRSNACKCACCDALMRDDWQSFCIKTNSAIPACMQAITPDDVFEKLSGVL